MWGGWTLTKPLQVTDLQWFFAFFGFWLDVLPAIRCHISAVTLDAVLRFNSVQQVPCIATRTGALNSVARPSPGPNPIQSCRLQSLHAAASRSSQA